MCGCCPRNCVRRGGRRRPPVAERQRAARTVRARRRPRRAEWGGKRRPLPALAPARVVRPVPPWVRYWRALARWMRGRAPGTGRRKPGEGAPRRGWQRAQRASQLAVWARWELRALPRALPLRGQRCRALPQRARVRPRARAVAVRSWAAMPRPGRRRVAAVPALPRRPGLLVAAGRRQAQARRLASLRQAAALAWRPVRPQARALLRVWGRELSRRAPPRQRRAERWVRADAPPVPVEPAPQERGCSLTARRAA